MAYYVPLTICLNGMDIIFGIGVIDRLSPSQRVRLLGATHAVGALVALTILRVRTEATLCSFAVAYGVVAGARETLRVVVLGSLFGTVALGRIQGVHQAVSLLSTGFAPLLWAVSMEVSGGPRPVVGASSAWLLCSAAAVVALSACLGPSPKRAHTILSYSDGRYSPA